MIECWHLSAKTQDKVDLLRKILGWSTVAVAVAECLIVATAVALCTLCRSLRAPLMPLRKVPRHAPLPEHNAPGLELVLGSRFHKEFNPQHTK